MAMFFKERKIGVVLTSIFLSVILIASLLLGIKSVITTGKSETIDAVYALDEITSDINYQQTIQPNQDGLSAIYLTMATFGRYNTSQLFVELTDELGQRIHFWTIPCTSISDNDNLILDLDNPLYDSRDKTYNIIITSDAQTNNGVTIYCNNAEGASGLLINGNQEDLTLCYQLSYQLTVGKGIAQSFKSSPCLFILLFLFLITIPIICLFLLTRYGIKPTSLMLLPTIVFSLLIHRIIDHIIFKVGDPTANNLILFMLIYCIAWIAISVLVFELLYKQNIPLEKIATLVVLFFSITSMLFFTPGSIPDEESHYVISYYYSNYLIPTSDVSSSIKSIYLRNCDKEFLQTCMAMTIKSTNYVNLLNHTEFFTNDSTTYLTKAEELEIVGIDHQSPAPMGYFISAIGIALSRIFHLGAIPTFYMGRLFNILAFVLAIYWSIKIIPVGKELIFVISLLPMVSQEVASYSYDGFIIGISFLFTAVIISIIYASEKTTWNKLIVLTILCAVLAPSKLVYLPLIGAVLAIQSSKIPFNKPNLVKFAIISIGIISLFVFQSRNLMHYINLGRVLANTTNYVSSHNIFAYQNNTFNYSIVEFISNPLAFLELLLITLFSKIDWYLSTLVGNPLGWFQINVPTFVWGFYLIIIIAASIRSNDERNFLNLKNKFLFVTLSFASVLLIIVSMSISYPYQTAEIIEGVQGRYFLPFLLLLMMALKPKTIVKDGSSQKKIVWITSYYGFAFWIVVYLTVLGAI